MISHKPEYGTYNADSQLQAPGTRLTCRLLAQHRRIRPAPLPENALILILVDEFVGADPEHQRARPRADFLDWERGRLRPHRLERRLVELVFEHPIAGEPAPTGCGLSRRRMPRPQGSRSRQVYDENTWRASSCDTPPRQAPCVASVKPPHWTATSSSPDSLMIPLAAPHLSWGGPEGILASARQWLKLMVTR